MTTSTDLSKYYDRKKQRVIKIPIKLLNAARPKIVKLTIGKSSTNFKMVPEWFQVDNDEQILKDIVYPKGTTKDNQHLYNTIARYRSINNQPNNNFIQKSIEPKEKDCETLITGIDNFIQQLGGELSFTDEDILYQNPSYRAACGVANLSSAHLLVTDYISTAKFCFLIDLDYQSDLARTSETMQNFILNFSKGIADVLSCDSEYIRVISIEKPGKTRRESKITFGLSTPDRNQTEQLVQDLKEQAKRGFPNHRVLKHIKPNEYDCKWMPLISYFQLSPTDFDRSHDFDYKPGLLPKDKRGNSPYYLPIGWYRHALKVVHKYPDDKLWLGSSNVDGEWPVAFHGTHGAAVKGIQQKGLLITQVDLMRSEAVQLGGSKFDRPGLYVATHCNGGSHPMYTTPFEIPSSSGKTEKFRVVFQCRVKPNSFTIHTSPVKHGAAWRVVDPDAIRPYGILVKNEETPDVTVQDN